MSKSEVAIIGAGIQGVCNALFLQKKGIKSRKIEIDIREKLGVKQKILNPKEVHDLEPNLKPFYDGGVFYEYARHARNPKKIIVW